MAQKKIELNDDNYYTIEADKHYLSNSLIKKFQECEFSAMEYLEGRNPNDPSDAMLMGSYVDEALLGTPESFKAFKESHPEMISSRGETKGMLKSQFIRAEQMIKKAKEDKKFMFYLTGVHQKIMTGTIFGVPIKIKMDCYIPGEAIVDLKTTDSFNKKYWVDRLGRYGNFIEEHNYIQQLAIYQEIVFQNTGEKLPCYLACLSKEPVTDIDIFWIDNDTLSTYLFGNDLAEGIAEELMHIDDVCQGNIPPQKCGMCDCCKKGKKVIKPRNYLDLLGD